MSHNDFKEGWGVIDADGLNIRTVSDTRRAAIVNWLVVQLGIVPLRDETDDEIESKWTRFSGDAMVRPVRCYVQP